MAIPREEVAALGAPAAAGRIYFAAPSAAHVPFAAQAPRAAASAHASVASSSAPSDVAVARDPAKPQFDINPDLSPSERQHMISILTDLMYAFALHPSLVPAPAPGITHRINLLDPTLPQIKQAAYRESPEKQAAIAAKVA